MTMNLLIAVASRHGSTLDIGRAIAQELRMHGHTVAVREVGEVRDAGRYGAVIIGSAIYLGDWLPEGCRFVERNAEMLASLPVWLFSSGPLGREDPEPKGDPDHLDELL